MNDIQRGHKDLDFRVESEPAEYTMFMEGKVANGSASPNSAMDAMREIRAVMESEQDAFSKCHDIREILARHQ